jgi:hypothetical protein
MPRPCHLSIFPIFSVNNDKTRSGQKTSVAFGTVYSEISDHFDQSYLLQSLPVLGAEKAFEVNYMFQATHWLMLQPVVQYFDEVGAEPHQGDAVAAGFRLKIAF